MNCKFCGAPLEAGEQQCPACNKAQAPTTAELMDNMPALHDELSRIGELRRKAEKRPRRIVLAVVLVLLCLVVAAVGIFYFHGIDARRQSAAVATQATPSAVAGQVRQQVLSGDAISVLVYDADTAKDAILSVYDQLGVTDDATDFLLSSMHAFGDDTYYRFFQTWNNLPVYGGEVIVSASKDGRVYGLNAKIVETTGLDKAAALNEGAASNAISAYVNKLSATYRLVDGIRMTDIQKVVCNFDGYTHLAYMKNLSGYNEKGEYTAYDVLVDADSGYGIFVRHTASFENETATAEATTTEASATETPATEQSQETTAIPTAKLFSANNAQMTMYAVSDKFNWNDPAMPGALELLDKTEVDAGNASGYLISAKQAVDKAYAYFADRLDYRGLDGWNGAFSVLINANEYLADRLPPERALYHDGVMVFFQEDMIAGMLSPDVAAHEYSHGVLASVAAFDGTEAATENAAVAEGLADAFGELSELYFTGSADWLHAERNIGAPDRGFLAKLPDEVEILDVAGCYYYSTVLSHAVHNMWAGGVPEEALSQLLMRSVYFMTNGADFAQWRTAMELAARTMTANGLLTAEQGQAVLAALEQSGIRGPGIPAPQGTEDAFGQTDAMPKTQID